MTRVVFYKDGDSYYGFHEFGHAGLDEVGKDIVCAAISAMTMLIINTIEVVWASDVKYEIDDETTDITVTAKEAIPEYAETGEKQFAISGLFYSYYLQLCDMMEDYYDYLDVDVEEKPYDLE